MAPASKPAPTGCNCPKNNPHPHSGLNPNFEQAIEEVIWLICLLANQDVAIWNLQHPDDKREELSTEVVELLTVPGDLTSYKSAITAALEEGTRRAIVSEPDPKDSEQMPAK